MGKPDVVSLNRVKFLPHILFPIPIPFSPLLSLFVLSQFPSFPFFLLSAFHIVLGVETKNPITKHPKHNTQDFKMSKVTKCQKFQNVQGIVQNYKKPEVTKCSKLQNVISYKMSKVTKCLKFQNL